MSRIRVIDFETTGMEPPEAQVIEAGWCDLVLADPATSEWSIWHPDSRLYSVPCIPPEARAVHHIGMADVAGKEPFSGDVLHADLAAQGVLVVAHHNAAFDGRFFTSPVPTICTYKAALRVWPEAPGHSNGTLRYWLADQGLIRLVDVYAQPPHRAGADAYVTAHILKALLARTTGKEMVGWTREPAFLPTCPIGKFRGKPWPDVEGGFLDWMTRQPDMEADLKWNARRELDRRRAAAA